jgi:hypothetical protein
MKLLRWLKDVVLVFVLALALLVASCLEGCRPGRTAQDAARAGVISLAGATRMVYLACVDAVIPVAENPNATPAELLKAKRVAEACDEGLQTAKAELEEAADEVDGDKAPEAACHAVRAASVLSGTVAVLRASNVETGWEVAQAIKVGQAASPWCQP